MSLPILYSFRRCPYAMRARLALALSNTRVELREVELKNKPDALRIISPKATVPVLQIETEEGREDVIDESIDIAYWALLNNDPYRLLPNSQELREEVKQLIHTNDNEFKSALDRYKYFDRYPEFSQAQYRGQGETFLHQLNSRLEKHKFILSDKISIADIAIMPFIRQFAHVDIDWFKSSRYEHVINWLNFWLESNVFQSIMKKYKPWQEGSTGEDFNPSQEFHLDESYINALNDQVEV